MQPSPAPALFESSGERAIKRLKVDPHAEHLTHRDALRVQAHLDRKLLTMHLLLKVAASP